MTSKYNALLHPLNELIHGPEGKRQFFNKDFYAAITANVLVHITELPKNIIATRKRVVSKSTNWHQFDLIGVLLDTGYHVFVPCEASRYVYNINRIVSSSTSKGYVVPANALSIDRINVKYHTKNPNAVEYCITRYGKAAA